MDRREQYPPSQQIGRLRKSSPPASSLWNNGRKGLLAKRLRAKRARHSNLTRASIKSAISDCPPVVGRKVRPLVETAVSAIAPGANRIAL
jgi:hypothetical protein